MSRDRERDYLLRCAANYLDARYAAMTGRSIRTSKPHDEAFGLLGMLDWAAEMRLIVRGE